MEFITTDGKLEIKENVIFQKRLTDTYRRNILISAYFFLFFVNLLFKNVDKINETGKISAWIGTTFNVVAILLYVLLIVMFLYKRVLSRKLDIYKISEIKLTDSEEGLEKNVVIKTNNNRYKVYKFRFLEKEYERLIQYLVETNSGIRIVTE
jgi:hypothetical protein